MFLSITPLVSANYINTPPQTHPETIVHKFSAQFSLKNCAKSEEWCNITVGMYEAINKARRRASEHIVTLIINGYCYNEVVLLYVGSLHLLSLASRQQL